MFPSISELVIVVGLIWLSGCGSRELATIEAVVLPGEHQDIGATVLFASNPAQENGSVVAIINDRGKCEFDYGETIGVTPGTYDVTITLYTMPDGKPLPEGEEGAMLIATGKAQQVSYQLHCDLQPGPNQLLLRVDEAEAIID